MKKSFLLVLLLISLFITFSVAASAYNDFAASEEISPNDTANDNVICDNYYTINKSVYMEVFTPDYTSSIIVYEKIINADIDNDGKCTLSDARMVLRCAVSLEEIDNIAIADVNENGRIDASDTRIIIRYITHLDTHYICGDNTSPNGMYIDLSGNTLCFDNGILLTGINTIDGKKYLFSKKGYLVKNNTATINGKTYKTDDNGIVLEGFYTDSSDNTQYFINGVFCTGINTIDGERYLFSDEGYLIKNDTATINGKTYKADKDGILRDGFYLENDQKYYLNNGEVVNGSFYREYDLYFLKDDCTLAANETIGYFKYDANGVASTKIINSDTLSWHINQIIKKIGTDPYSIFEYVASSDNFSYKIMSPNTPDNMVLQMLRYHRGSCYQYTYLTKYLYDAAGYETVVVKGLSMTGEGDHWWLMVKIDGRWYHIDTEYPRSSGGTYMKTSAQMKRLGYRWIEDDYPVS